MKKMLTVNQVSKLTKVSIRTLQYYDKIGLLCPTKYTESGYRLYDDTALESLQQILLFRELEFPLKDIKSILSSPKFDRQKALQQQIELLELKREHLNELISLARDIKNTGVIKMDFNAFSTQKIEEYKERAKQQWGDSTQYKEFEKKESDRTDKDNEQIAKQFMQIFAGFGEIKDTPADSSQAQDQVKKLQLFITDNYYNCTNEVLAGLGKMYCADEEFRNNIDGAGGNGTAEFVSKAIKIYCAE